MKKIAASEECDSGFCAFRRCLADCPSGKLGVGKQSHQTQHTFATLENGILSILIVLKRILSHSSAFATNFHCVKKSQIRSRP